MDRAATARAAADALEATAASGALRPALVGFDGFIDAIIDAVDLRSDMTAQGYTRLRTIPEYAARVAAAAGKSANIELVVKEERFGGNGPLLAGALGRLGMPVTYVGAVGQVDSPRTLHPIFAEFAARCRQVIPVAPPSFTDALEFDDGKIMLGKPANVQLVTWDLLVEMLTLEGLRGRCDEAALLGVINWTQMGGVEGIWQGLAEHVLPALDCRGKRLFIDLADPAKRQAVDIVRGMRLLTRLNTLVPVTLGLNLSEAEQVAVAVGLDVFRQASNATFSMVLRRGAEALRERLALDCVVIHPREGAAAAHMAGSAWFEGPFTASPRLSTGAGDHFNGGFALAQVHGLPLEQCLAVGCAVSGAYVRDAESPRMERLVGFLRSLPGPE